MPHDDDVQLSQYLLDHPRLMTTLVDLLGKYSADVISPDGSQDDA